MLGYINAKQARAGGLTHHGSYYGIPMWLKPEGNEVGGMAKWPPLDTLVPVFIIIEMFMRSILFPDEPPCFQFTIGREI